MVLPEAYSELLLLRIERLANVSFAMFALKRKLDYLVKAATNDDERISHWGIWALTNHCKTNGRMKVYITHTVIISTCMYSLQGHCIVYS